MLEVSSVCTVGYQKLSNVYLKQGERDKALQMLQQMCALPDLKAIYYYCGNCGFKDTEIHWRCPQCRQWDTFVQDIEKRIGLSRRQRKGSNGQVESG